MTRHRTRTPLLGRSVAPPSWVPRRTVGLCTIERPSPTVLCGSARLAPARTGGFAEEILGDDLVVHGVLADVTGPGQTAAIDRDAATGDLARNDQDLLGAHEIGLSVDGITRRRAI